MTRSSRPLPHRVAWASITIFAACFGVSVPFNFAMAADVLPSQSRPDLPRAPTSPQGGFTLPPVPAEPVEKERLAPNLKVAITTIKVEGNWAVSDKELAALTTPYEGRELDFFAMQKLREELTRYYIDKGFINSGALLPDQEIADGVLTYRIVEGRLTELTLLNTPRLRVSVLEQRLGVGQERALNMHDLQERLQLLQQDGLIERFEAQLTPGGQRGEADLRLLVEEARPYQLTFGLANNRPPSVGGVRPELAFHHGNVLGFADAFSVRAGLTEGVKDLTADYRLPIGPYHTALAMRYSRSDSLVVEAPFQDLDIESDTTTFSFAIHQSLLRRLNRNLSLSLSYDDRKSVSTLLGERFSFSSGVPDGEAKVAAVRFAQDFTWRSARQAVAVRSTFSFGESNAETVADGEGPADSFTTWLLQGQWAYRWDGGGQMLARADMQLSEDMLYAMERFSLGGRYSVRGYRENLYLRDSGYAMSLEYRHPIWRKKLAPHTVALAVFADHGVGWNRDDSPQEELAISSMGLGVRWSTPSRFDLEAYWAVPFDNLDVGDDLQDSGVHFAMAYRFF